MSIWMVRSGLPEILRQRGLTMAGLRRALEQEGVAADLDTLTHLAVDRPATGKLDLDLVTRVCRALGIGLDQLIHVEELRDEDALRRLAAYRFPEEKQRRLDHLLDCGNAGQLSPAERRELDDLVDEYDELSLAAARATDTLRRKASA